MIVLNALGQCSYDGDKFYHIELEKYMCAIAATLKVVLDKKHLLSIFCVPFLL